ncbi:MAG: UTP pyrophosphatase [Candidatus Alkanophagales archaeon MCA70_species_2]|nr:UTP pyrophosphatase [Candidatus Alkanophaga liquidiphilum]RLG36824.1 MAG: hypothetical protein DRN91_07045 [Candidatus Alkanophagales archaeon]
MDSKESLLDEIKRLMDELMRESGMEVFGEVHVKIADIEDLALIKGNDIYFSTKVKELPRDVLKYIIAHELAHLIVKRHAFKFWEVVRNMCPDYEKGMNKLSEILRRR